MGIGARQRGDRSKNLVGFRVGEVRYAVDIQRVKEIINPLPLVDLPHAPEMIIGVADHRGEVVPVLDLRLRFGLPPAAPTRRTKWVILGTEGRSVGLIVDAVTEVFGAGPHEQRDVPSLGVGDARRGISAVYSHDGELVFVIDSEAVVSPTAELDFEGLERLR